MSPAKVMLSPKERELVTDAGWILTKNRIIGKVYTLFGHLSEQYRVLWQQYPMLAGTGSGFHSPKISKGEQYRGLPWVMLDQPRHFTATESFAIRNFFWWGNFCSITLQLSEKYQIQYAAGLQEYFRLYPEKQAGWYLAVGEDAWEHHFETDNYAPLSEQMDIVWTDVPFLKLAKKIPLQEWDGLTDFFERTYQEMLQMLAVSCY